jgi:hypothetical protein
MSHAKQLHNRRYLDDSVEIINRTGLPGNVKVEVGHHVQEMVIATVQGVIEQTLEEELMPYLAANAMHIFPGGGVRNRHGAGRTATSCSRNTGASAPYAYRNFGEAIASCLGVPSRAMNGAGGRCSTNRLWATV